MFDIMLLSLLENVSNTTDTLHNKIALMADPAKELTAEDMSAMTRFLQGRLDELIELENLKKKLSREGGANELD